MKAEEFKSRFNQCINDRDINGNLWTEKVRKLGIDAVNRIDQLESALSRLTKSLENSPVHVQRFKHYSILSSEENEICCAYRIAMETLEK